MQEYGGPPNIDVPLVLECEAMELATEEISEVSGGTDLKLLDAHAPHIL